MSIANYPNLTPFTSERQPKNSGRKPSAGLSVREWVNSMQDWEEADLRKVCFDRKLPWTKRLAAKRMLHAIENPDLADFNDYLEGGVDLIDLRDKGIDTALVKKAKVKTRTIERDGAEPIVEVEREIELHERSADDFDRLLDQTAGKPIQPVALDAAVTSVEIAIPGLMGNQTPQDAISGVDPASPTLIEGSIVDPERSGEP